MYYRIAWFEIKNSDERVITARTDNEVLNSISELLEEDEFKVITIYKMEA